MRRKTAAELDREAEEKRQQARVVRAQEAKRERGDSRYRQSVLGACLQHAMKTDLRLRAEVSALMKRFCTRPRDRELFGFDAATTWFDKLDAAPSMKPGDSEASAKSDKGAKSGATLPGSSAGKASAAASAGAQPGEPGAAGATGGSGSASSAGSHGARPAALAARVGDGQGAIAAKPDRTLTPAAAAGIAVPTEASSVHGVTASSGAAGAAR